MYWGSVGCCYLSWHLLARRDIDNGEETRRRNKTTKRGLTADSTPEP